jgi:hypothetical protein
MITDPTEKKLKAILFRRFCPTELELGEFELELLDKPRQDEIASHIANCPHCQKDLEQIRQATSLSLIEEQQTDQLPEGTPSLTQRAKVFVVNLLSPPPGALMPSSLQVAVRGQDDEMETQVIQAGTYMVALSLERDTMQLDTYNLIGDISVLEETGESANLADWQAFLWQDDVLLQTVSLQDASDFVFTGIRTSDRPYELIISGPAAEIHLQGLQIPGGIANQD